MNEIVSSLFALSEVQYTFAKRLNGKLEETNRLVITEGRSIANDIFDCSDESAAEAMLEKAYGDVNAISARCEKEVVAKIEELATDCQTQLDEFYNSDFSNSLRFRLESKRFIKPRSTHGEHLLHAISPGQ